MAEALVNLTAFLTRMTADKDETVAAPVDVALLSLVTIGNAVAPALPTAIGNSFGSETRGAPNRSGGASPRFGPPYRRGVSVTAKAR